MSDIPSISASFRQLVSDTEAALIDDSNVVFPSDVPKKLHFMQGNIAEVNARLQEMTNSPQHKGKKYPLFVLFRDIKEGLNEERFGLSTAFNAKFAIFTLTNPKYTSDQREEKTFTPILRPILEEIINQISKSKAFGMPTVKQMKIEKWDCFFYGSSQNNKNPFGDYLDAIEVPSISLVLKNKCN